MERKHWFMMSLLVILQSRMAFSQEENSRINVFGYFQSTFDHIDPKPGRKSEPSNSFYLQQLNIMVAHEFSPNLNSFINFEVTNNYSSNKNWGSFSLQEAWVKYRFSNELNIKAGMLVPIFNNLNEIKNRTPLLPYIFRPFVYEASVMDIFPLNQLVPEQAFLQLYGNLSLGDVKLDYATYIGNGPEYTNAIDGNYFSRGIDTTLFKMAGGRAGIRIGSVKAGFSMTTDKEDESSLGIGPVQRYRMGADFSFEYSGLAGEFEFITIEHPMTPEQRATLAAAASMNPSLGTDLDKLFYYGLLNYYFNERFFGYAGYNHLSDQSIASFNAGLQAYTFGGGYQPNNHVVVKAQYILFKLRDNPFFKFREDHYMLAVSVFF